MLCSHRSLKAMASVLIFKSVTCHVSASVICVSASKSTIQFLLHGTGLIHNTLITYRLVILEESSDRGRHLISG